MTKKTVSEAHAIAKDQAVSLVRELQEIDMLYAKDDPELMSQIKKHSYEGASDRIAERLFKMFDKRGWVVSDPRAKS
jgi:hypothetical protein